MKRQPPNINDLREQIAQMTRREFIKRSAATGMALGLPPFLLSCGSNHDAPPPRTETRTLFFNFAHEKLLGKDYFLVAGGRHYPLTNTHDAQHVLKKARAGNKFLRAMPDESITHHIENIELPNDSVTMCYVGNTINSNLGTWSMSMIYLHIPNSGSDYAFEMANGNVPLSNKRACYAQPAAQSAQDLREENALVDSYNHAATLIMLHPGLLSAEPNSAHYIYTNHVGTGILTQQLSDTLQNLGPALPQQFANKPNPTGWATMMPLLDDKNAPVINPNNQLIQYDPDWHPSVDANAAPGMNYHINNTRNDATLGATVVRGKTNQPEDINGKIWFQREGFTTVDTTSGKAAAIVGDNNSITLLDHSPESGCDVTASLSGSGANVIANFTVSNSYLRYLGIYVQFLNDNKKPIPLTSIGSYPDGIQNGHDKLLDTTTEMFLDVVAPELTILGIPVAEGTSTISITVPPEARYIKLLASGLSIGGVAPNNHSDTIGPGVGMTAMINYGFTMIFMAAGVGPASLESFIAGLARGTLLSLIDDVINLVETAITDSEELSTAAGWDKIAKMFLNLVGKSAATGAGKALLALLEYVIGVVTAATVANSLPLVGQIHHALSCLVGVIDMSHTTWDLALSPWTYVNTFSQSHDLSITLLPDPNNGNGFPAAATQYKVTAMFEDGTPYVQTFPLSNPGLNLPPVIFKGVPLGGKANISVSFSQQGVDDILLGKGTTGLIDNVANAQPTITIEELKFPIGSGTTYQHQQKTTLTAGQPGGAPVHVWSPTKIAPTATAASLDSGNQSGDLAALGSITVRQATLKPPVNGYIGYSWRSFSSGVADCSNGAVGQLDQVVNLNSLSAQAQNGYVASRCGLPSGVKVAYSLLSHGTTNFYLDTSIAPGSSSPVNLIRRIQLDPVPGFDAPNSNLAWGKLNFTSTALLLHPAGKLISISVTDHQMETLKLPDAALSDKDATTQLRAIRHGGQGKLPGLFSAPTAAAISPDGVVLVLEQGNNRIQAFDVNGNPVSYFTGQSQPYFLNLTATQGGDTQYLDLAVEYTGFLYVLSYNQVSQRYQMDIYHPTQTGTAPVSTTINVNAGRLTVDFWRNVYTLNFEVMQLNGAFPAVTEPSVSLWTPCAAGNAC